MAYTIQCVIYEQTRNPQDKLHLFIVSAPGHQRNPTTPFPEPSVIVIINILV